MNRCTVAATLAALIATVSLTAQASDFDEPGLYVTLGGYNGFENFNRNTEAVEEFDPTFGNAMGFQVRLGFRANAFLAAEIEGDFTSGFPVNIPAGPDNPEVPEGTLVPFDLEGGNVTFNVKAVAPLGRFEPYALVGVGGMWTNLVTGFNTGTVCAPGWYGGWWCTGTRTRLADGGGFVAKFGGGFDLWMTEDFALTMDATYVYPTGDLSVLQYISLNWGAKFKF